MCLVSCTIMVQHGLSYAAIKKLLTHLKILITFFALQMWILLLCYIVPVLVNKSKK